MGSALHRVLPAVMAALLVAGCMQGPTERDDGDVALGPEQARFSQQVLYLGDDEGLHEQPPEEAGSVPAGDFILKWSLQTGIHPSFDAPFDPESPPQWISPHNASVTLYLSTDQPVLPAEGALPDVAVWLGSGHHAPLVASAKLDGPLLPGEVVPVTFDLPGPAGQGAILALQGVSLIVTITMTQLEEHGVRILTGGKHASHVRLDTREFQRGEIEGEVMVTDQEIAGEVLLFDRLLGPAPVPDLNWVDHEITVEETDEFILAFVIASGGGHTVDMDMELLGADGGTITWGVTPYPYEILWIAGPELDPYRGETLTLRIYNHLGIYMEYEGIIQTG